MDHYHHHRHRLLRLSRERLLCFPHLKKTLNTTCSKLAAEGGPKSLDISVTDSATQLPREKLVIFTPKPAKRQASEGATQAQHN